MSKNPDSSSVKLKFMSKMNSRQENRSRLSFTGRIITKYSLERILCIFGENMSWLFKVL